MKKQTGSIHVIIIVGLVALLIGALGFIFWQNFVNSKSKNSESTTNNKDSTQLKKPDRTEGWYTYSPAGNEFTLRLPDGWKLYRSEGGDGSSLYGFNPEDIVYEAGVKAVVADVGGRDWGAIPYLLKYSSDDSAFDGVVGSLESTSSKTNSGLTIYKYYYVTPSDPEVMGPPKGTRQYYYLIKKDETKKGSSMVVIQHDVAPSESDQRALIEESIKTLSFK